MAVVRSVVRSVKGLVWFGWYGLDLWLRNPRTRPSRAAWLQKFTASLLRAFDVKFTYEGSFPRSGVLISNHTSYLDIAAYGAMNPQVYCAKAEMEHWPFMGWMTKMVGTVFVDRGAGGSAAKAGVGMRAAEAEGVPVVFFPEGTTSDGSVVLPFRSGLLAVSLDAEQPITAAFIHYTLNERNGPRGTVADAVSFWGEHAQMLPHIFRFFGLRGVQAHVRIASEPIRFSPGALEDRKVAAIEARRAVLALATPEVQRKSVEWDNKAAVLHYK